MLWRLYFMLFVKLLVGKLFLWFLLFFSLEYFFVRCRKYRVILGMYVVLVFLVDFCGDGMLLLFVLLDFFFIFVKCVVVYWCIIWYIWDIFFVIIIFFRWFFVGINFVVIFVLIVVMMICLFIVIEIYVVWCSYFYICLIVFIVWRYIIMYYNVK